MPPRFFKITVRDCAGIQRRIDGAVPIAPIIGHQHCVPFAYKTFGKRLVVRLIAIGQNEKGRAIRIFFGAGVKRADMHALASDRAARKSDFRKDRLPSFVFF